MKVNRTTSIICMALTILFGVATAILQCKSVMLAGISLSIFTGFIITVVVALIGYFYEKEKLKNKLHSYIKSLYINLISLKDITGFTLAKIATTTNLRDLDFDLISSLADLNVKLSSDVDLESYNGFFSKSKTACIYKDFLKYVNQLYNLKHLTSQLLIDSNKHDLQVLTHTHQHMQGQWINPQEAEQLLFLKNAINIRTAKLHEYEASLIIELDNLANRAYGRKTNWNDVKLLLHNEADDILSTRS